MEQGENTDDYSSVVENLTNLFGNIMNQDVITTIVESCGGDLNLSVDAIMNITNDGSTRTDEGSNTAVVPQPETSSSGSQNVVTPSQLNQPSTSYSSVAQTAYNTGAIPKQREPRPVKPVVDIWSDQIRQIIAHHNRGHRILLLMRGVPGSGKSYLSKKLVEMMIGPTMLDYRTHVFSTDDFFLVNGHYYFNSNRLSEAHAWNQNRVRLALYQGLSPVIVDNTNINLWEMKPYVHDGVINGYIIEVLEPNTPWAKKADHLCRKNIHNVPITTIKRMLDNYSNISSAGLRQNLGLLYPVNMMPPVMRLIPPVNEPAPTSSKDDVVEVNTVNSPPSLANISATQSQVNVGENSEPQSNMQEKVENSSNVVVDVPANTYSEAEADKKENNDNSDDLAHESDLKQKVLIEAQKRLEEIQKVEQDWENGENWDDDKQDEAAAVAHANTDQKSSNVEPKPPRNCKAELDEASAKSLMLTVNNCQDWRQISMFMPPWNDNKPSTDSAEEVPVQTKSSGTCMEIGDSEAINGRHKVISTVPRYINEFSMALPKEKIPVKRMLDKSSMTNEQDLLTVSARCKNEEKHFIAFRKLFKNIARADLRDIFDKCQGDVNWAVDIVLDGMANKQLKTVDTEELSDVEDDCLEQCNCVAAYNIIPDLAIAGASGSPVAIAANIQGAATEATPHSQKKSKKEPMSDESLQIKRQIEENVTIGDSHYSEHCLKIRKWRHREASTTETDPEQAMPNCANSDTPDTVPAESNDATSDDDSSVASANDSEKIVCVTLGSVFVSELDKFFGRADMEYPEFIEPKIYLPMSVLNEINAFWMESLMHQIERQAKQSALMVQQDEEFARQLAMKEAELAQEGKEPAVPDFKEIMDLDAALALYQKDVAEWRNNMPKDWAAKMTREKLHNLFPEIEKDTLTELLMAHDNNFQSTVEVLLMSMGRSDILEKENGVNKFVMEREFQRQERILEERKALSDADWPLLPRGEVVEMSVVQGYREEADQHLLYRNINYNKAQEYIRRGMTQVASHFSEIAAYHKRKFEQANSMAAASLMQVHAKKASNSATIDLHYLHVSEAREALDLFIDRHIQRLREAAARGGPSSETLFFITGRGLHSAGGPRVKPAVRSRLRERGLGCQERNPGLYSSRVCAEDKLSYQVKVP